MTTREQKLAAMPSSMRSTYQKALKSRTAAVKAFCQECCGYDRAAVRECPAVACSLYVFRPYQTADEQDGTDASEPTAE